MLYTEKFGLQDCSGFLQIKSHIIKLKPTTARCRLYHPSSSCSQIKDFQFGSKCSTCLTCTTFPYYNKCTLVYISVHQCTLVYISVLSVH